jgi:hypothetical protein
LGSHELVDWFEISNGLKQVRGVEALIFFDHLVERGFCGLKRGAEGSKPDDVLHHVYDQYIGGSLATFKGTYVLFAL